MGASLSSEFANVSSDLVYVVSSALVSDFSICLVDFEPQSHHLSIEVECVRRSGLRL